MLGQPITQDNIENIVSYLKKNVYKFHQFYNLEIESDEFNFIDYMLKYKDSQRAKVLNKSYYDIEILIDPEIFPDPDKAAYMVNSVALYNNVTNIAYIICVTKGCNLTEQSDIQAGVNELYQDTCKTNDAYSIDNLKIEVIVAKDEKELLTTFFKLVQELNTLMLIGFNSSTFDDPYMINRTSNLFGADEMPRIISEFGIVTKYGERSFELPDYLLVDILKLYKPVGSGGGGLGKSLPDFKLNTICEKELGITKLDLEEGFNDVYYKDIVRFTTYNLLDTLLTFKLDSKLMFMELMFDLSKYNNATMGATISGRSLIYLYRNDLMYSSQNKLIRVKKFSKEVLFDPNIKA